MSVEVLAGVSYREIGGAEVVTVDLRRLLCGWGLDVNPENCALVRGALVDALVELAGAVTVELGAPTGAPEGGVS